MAKMNNEVVEEPRRWAPSRIASAAVLVLLVLGGIAYGIYSLTSNNGNGTKPQSSNLTAPTPGAKSSPKSSSKTPPGSSSSKSTGSNSTVQNGTSSSSSAASGSTSQSGQLSNTGPGSVAIVGFIGAFIVGTALHYGWRRLRSTPSA